jgi:hypothetical protein
VQGEFSDDVSGAFVGPIFTVTTSEDGTPQRLPKRRRKIRLAHLAKTLKTKIENLTECSHVWRLRPGVVLVRYICEQLQEKEVK